MTLKPCSECGKKVSTDATTCPNCGKPHPAARAGPAARDPAAQRTSIALIAPGAVVVAIAIAVLAYLSSRGAASDPAERALSAAIPQSQSVATDSIPRETLSDSEAQFVVRFLRDVVKRNRWLPADPLLAGGLTDHPVLWLEIPGRDWKQLGISGRRRVVLYMPTLVGSARSKPDAFLSLSRSAPAYAGERAALTTLSDGAWEIISSPVYRDEQGKFTMDANVIVCGDAVANCEALSAARFLRDSASR